MVGESKQVKRSSTSDLQRKGGVKRGASFLKAEAAAAALLEAARSGNLQQVQKLVDGRE